MLTKYKNGLSSADLKLIAVITMLIDHIGAILIEGCLMQSGFMPSGAFTASHDMPGYGLAIRLYYIDILLRLTGRTAFPLFAFMIVQGFMHTHSRKAYLIRLLLFALVSQIPFHLAASLTVMDSANVLFTLTLGLICIWVLELIREKLSGSSFAIPLAVIVVFCCCAASWYIDSDYSQYGVLSIMAFYLFRKQPVQGAVAACTILMVSNPYYEFAAFLSVFLISRYNGEKGEQHFGKYFFYAFYPAHLLILYGIVRLILRM